MVVLDANALKYEKLYNLMYILGCEEDVLILSDIELDKYINHSHPETSFILSKDSYSKNMENLTEESVIVIEEDSEDYITKILDFYGIDSNKAHNKLSIKGETQQEEKFTIIEKHVLKPNFKGSFKGIHAVVFARVNRSAYELAVNVVDRYIKKLGNIKITILDLDTNPVYSQLYGINRLHIENDLTENSTQKPLKLSDNIDYIQGSIDIFRWENSLLKMDWNRKFDELGINEESGLLLVIMNLENNFINLFSSFTATCNSFVYTRESGADLRECLLKINKLSDKVTLIMDTAVSELSKYSPLKIISTSDLEA